MSQQLPYEEIEGVNFSTLKWIMDSPLDYRHKMNQPRKDTTAMQFGRLADNIALDRDQLEADFIYWDESHRPNQEISKSTGKPFGMTQKDNKEWLEWLQEQANDQGKTLVPLSEIQKADHLVNTIRTSPTIEAAKARELLWTLPGENQKVITWEDEETGIKCKGRVDRLLEHQVVDLKVYANFSPELFPKSAGDYSLDMQAVMYMEGTGKQTFRWVVVEPVPPHNVCVYVMQKGSETWQCGYNKYQYCLNKLKEIRETGLYPGVGSQGLLGEFPLHLRRYHLNQWVEG